MKFPVVDGIPFRSKEMSWLAFNSRVLQEAADGRLPLGERLKFLGIYSSNLDEFFRVRMATLRRLVLLGKDYRKLRLPDPRETLREARRLIRRDGLQFDVVYRDILRGMAKAGVRLVNEKDVPRPLWDWLYEYFFESVRPHIMPVMVRSYSRFETLADTSMYLAVELGRHDRKGREAHALMILSGSGCRACSLGCHTRSLTRGRSSSRGMRSWSSTMISRRASMIGLRRD
jgi:polyphosphate kinase